MAKKKLDMANGSKSRVGSASLTSARMGFTTAWMCSRTRLRCKRQLSTWSFKNSFKAVPIRHWSAIVSYTSLRSETRTACSYHEMILRCKFASPLWIKRLPKEDDLPEYVNPEQILLRMVLTRGWFRFVLSVKTAGVFRLFYASKVRNQLIQ